MLKNLWVGMVLLLGLALFSFPAFAYPDFYMSVSPDTLSVCPCTTVGSFTGYERDMELRIRNEGEIADTYELYLGLPGDDWSGFIYNSRGEITLGPDEERVVNNFWITPGCGVEPGSYTVTIGAKSKSSGEERKITLDMEILSCHRAELEIPQSGRTCRGMPLEVGVNATNYGKYEERFSLRASADWVVFSPETLSLESGGTGSLTMRLEPPKELKGTESVTVFLESLDSYGKDSGTFRLDIQDCYSFSAGLEPSSQQVCTGKSASYALRISNTGSRQDSYSIYTPNWVSSGSGSLSLGPGESRDIALAASPAGTGEFMFNVTVVSSMQPTYPELRRTVQGTADSKECRGVAVVVSPSSLEVCSKEGAEYQVTVKNTGTISGTFELETTAGTLEQDRLILGAGESAALKLFISPGISPGDRKVKVSASSDGVLDEDEADLLVENCYSANISIEPASAVLCPCSSVLFEAVLENTGKYADNYSFSMEGMGESLKETLELLPGGSETLELEIPVSCGTRAGDYRLKAVAESGNAKAEREADLTVSPMEECYSLALSSEKDSLKTLRGKGTVFSILVENRGTAPDSYILALEGPEWSYLGTEELDLEPGESRTVYLYASPEYGSELREYGLKLSAVSERSSANLSLALDVVLNMTEPGTQEPDTTPNASMNVSIHTGQVIGEAVALSWNIIAVTIIALAIVVILISRFAVLVR